MSSPTERQGGKVAAVGSGEQEMGWAGQIWVVDPGLRQRGVRRLRAGSSRGRGVEAAVAADTESGGQGQGVEAWERVWGAVRSDTVPPRFEVYRITWERRRTKNMSSLLRREEEQEEAGAKGEQQERQQEPQQHEEQQAAPSVLEMRVVRPPLQSQPLLHGIELLRQDEGGGGGSSSAGEPGMEGSDAGVPAHWVEMVLRMPSVEGAQSPVAAAAAAAATSTEPLNGGLVFRVAAAAVPALSASITGILVRMGMFGRVARLKGSAANLQRQAAERLRQRRVRG
jgi:hypothetical protein